MKVLCPRILLLTVCATALLGGCSSSSSSSSPDEGALDDPTIEVGTDTNLDEDTDAETDTDTESDTGSEADTDTESDTGPETGGDTSSGGDLDSDADANTDGDAGIDIFVPDVANGSDLDRLLKGLKRQVSLTLLDLNKSLSEGVTLTDQQQLCLGAYDPAAGEQLLAINCDMELATADISVYVSEAAFYATDNCHASLFAGNTDNCQLQQADIRLPALWRVPEGERRPTLVFAGSKVTYALTDTMLQITNIESALAGPFLCDYDLATSTATSTAPSGTSCTDTIAATADNLDDVVPR